MSAMRPGCAAPQQHAAALARACRARAGSRCSSLSELLSTYNDLQLASGAYYFVGARRAHGADGAERPDLARPRRADGRRRLHGRAAVGNEHWALVPALVAAIVVTALVGVLVGAAATRLRGPYLAGATLAFAIGLPALADKYPNMLGGENGLIINPPTPPSWLGANFPLERWEAWIAVCGSAGRAVRAEQHHAQRRRALVPRGARRRDRGVAVRPARRARADARVHHQRRVRRARRGLLAVVLQLAAPGAFEARALAVTADRDRARRARLARRRVWGAAVLVLLPAGRTISRTRSRCRRTSRPTFRSRSTGSS